MQDIYIYIYIINSISDFNLIASLSLGGSVTDLLLSCSGRLSLRFLGFRVSGLGP